ncbi:hypothetical protein GCM10023089_23400 [Quisquiliibacterium transsilvanicum]
MDTRLLSPATGFKMGCPDAYEETAERYGTKVQAASMANFEYAARHARFSKSTSMRPPPSIGRKFPGYLVVRKVGRRDQYETWMPESLFEELYAPAEPSTGSPDSNTAKANDA